MIGGRRKLMRGGILGLAVALGALWGAAGAAQAEEATTTAIESDATSRVSALAATRTERFVVERDGVALGTFTEVGGLGSETEVIEHRVGTGDSEIIRKIPGAHRVPDVTLKRGITSNRDLWLWRQEVVDGPFERSTVRITLLGSSGEPVAVWTLTNAWPSKVTGPAPKSDSGVPLEALTLSSDGIVRVQ